MYVSIPFTSGHVFRPVECSIGGESIVDVSIPFTSGHVFRLFIFVNPLGRRMYVSIPFTSGHVFRPVFEKTSSGWIETVSQSLLHQVTYSDPAPPLSPRSKKGCLNPFYIRSRIPTLHLGADNGAFSQCLNPFYIRSRIPTQRNCSSADGAEQGLNPFYIRSRIPTLALVIGIFFAANVSIPFTSGHVFRRRTQVRPSAPPAMSQSLLHQVTYSDVAVKWDESFDSKCLNPFYIRSRIPTRQLSDMVDLSAVMSQSLLHQVTYSDQYPNDGLLQKRQMSQSLLHQVTYSDTLKNCRTTHS